ncbi:MAG: TetR/AcrR family transcriptional regulator [Terricaulis sp.]
MPKVLSTEDIADFRERLCDAAEKQFGAHGLEGVTMRALAAALGVSPMTPYRYFKDKEEIVAAVQARAFDRFAAALEAATHADPAKFARNASNAYVRFAFDNPDAYRLMFDIAQAEQDQYPALIAAAERARKTMTGYVRALVDAGFIEGDPELIGHVYWATTHGLVMLKLANKLSPHLTFEAIGAEATRALSEGFRPKRH